MEVPLIEPFRISLGVITHSRSAIVSVETDEGLVGYGEGAPAILISGESLSGTNDVIKAMERELIGVDPTDLEKVYWIMDRTAAHSGSAKNAIDMACYDLLGKKAGMASVQTAWWTQELHRDRYDSRNRHTRSYGS